MLLMTEDGETVRSVSAVLESNGRLTDDDVCADLPSLVAQLERAPASGVLVDIDGRPARILSELEPIIARFMDTRFILLSNDQRNEWLLEAMQIGARHLLNKGAIPSELARVLHRVIPNGSTNGTGVGLAVCVLSASGGCGATTVAVNLAHELHAQAESTALLVDLDYSYGAVSSYLGVDAQYGIADVLADPSRIDAQLVRSSTVEYSDGVHVLVSPAGAGLSEPVGVDPRPLGPALSACRRAHQVTVVDAPRVGLDVADTLAQTCDRTLIVFQLTVKDLRFVRAAIAALVDRGIPSTKLMPIVNRYCRRHSLITLDDARQALGKIPLTTIRNDYRSASRGVNYGQPLAQAARRSGLCKDLRRLAGRIHESRAHNGTAVPGP